MKASERGIKKSKSKGVHRFYNEKRSRKTKQAWADQQEATR